ncbi:MAG TPA: XRE family transcriptional regulator [Bryobacteraceae bacterium]|nr:XRE family transcriptional regulator [Bryobacteraceae bacterium]
MRAGCPTFDTLRRCGRSSFTRKAEAKAWAVQHELLRRLKEIVRKHKFTHAEIAKRSETSRTRVTAILNDDLEHVSTDLLIRILASLGYGVKVTVTKSKTAA